MYDGGATMTTPIRGGPNRDGAPGLWTAPNLAPLAGLIHGFSGELASAPDHEQFARAVGFGSDQRVVRLRQVHGDVVVHAEDAVSRDEPLPGDAIVCDRPGIAIAVATADCVPILLTDIDAGVIAAVHAGWRGMRARIVPRTVEAMIALGASPLRLLAAIGPAVAGTCYEVGAEVRAAFDAAFGDASSLFVGRQLDLIAAARRELRSAGIESTHIASADRCTHCLPGLASHRRQGTSRGTNLSVILLRDGSQP